jgi:hypothetical protein
MGGDGTILGHLRHQNHEGLESAIMNVLKSLSAAQVVELTALSKTLEDLKSTKLVSIQFDLSSLTLDPALFTCVWGKP